VVLDFGNGKVWQSIAIAANKKFPYKMIDKCIKKEQKTAKEAFTANAKLFGNIVQRLTSYLNSVRRLDWVLTLKGEKDSKYLNLEVPLGHTVFKDKIKVKNTIRSTFEVDWPLDRVIGILSVIASTQDRVIVSFDKDNRAYLRTSDIDLLIPRRNN
jgi:hypothetical protein